MSNLQSPKRSFMQEDDKGLETIRSRFQNVIKRHAELTERLSRDSDKMIFERLQKEFEAARSSQDEEGDEWNDGLLATIRERVHMEAEQKLIIPGDTNTQSTPFLSKVTYRVGTTKIICCLEGARIGIQYDTSFADHIGELLQAYVDRREQVRLMRELYGNQIGELYHSLPYHMIDKVTVSLRYADLLSVLPTRVKVLAWPLNCPSKDLITSQTNKNASGVFPIHLIPARLSYAEDALQTMSLPEDIVLNLPKELQKMFPA
ncbi:hypothetical protein V2J09_019620 [Rumex salicifolius]